MKNSLRFPTIISLIAVITVILTTLSSKIDKSSEALMPYVQKFINASNGKITKEDIKEYVDIEMKDLGWPFAGNGRIGQCTLPFFGHKGKLEIDSTFWAVAANIEKKALIFHELGHCACTIMHPVEIKELDAEDSWFIKFLHSLGIKTVNRNKTFFMEDGCPKSLMHPRIASKVCLDAHWKEYEKVLFNICRPLSWVKLKFFEDMDK